MFKVLGTPWGLRYDIVGDHIMARAIRVQFEDAVYHVTARGNERKAIYRDARDRERFLGTLEETVNRFGLVIHAYCLMMTYPEQIPS